MKQSATIALILMTAILSLFPISLSAGSAGTPAVVTLQKHPKPKGSNPNPGQDGRRTPSTPVTVYFSKTEGLYSPYFDMEDVISFAILNDTGQSGFLTDVGVICCQSVICLRYASNRLDFSML